MQQARRSERDFTRERALPLQRLVPLLLNFRKGTNRDELEQFFETITDDPTSVTPVSEAAFCRARQKLKPEALVTLNNVLLDSANQQIAQQRWRGLRVLAVDGSTGRLPDFPAIEEYFGKPSGSGVPLARFSRLFDVLNDQILHADMVPYATGERELAAEYLLYSRPDDLFLYDRGYPAFWLFAFHAQEQRHYCARVRHDFHSEVKAFVADGAKERIVVLTPNTASARQCREGHLPADPLRVRLRCPPWRAKRRRVVPGSREATRDTRRAEGAKGDPKGASERGVQSYGRPVCSRNELAMLWRNAG